MNNGKLVNELLKLNKDAEESWDWEEKEYYGVQDTIDDIIKMVNDMKKEFEDKLSIDCSDFQKLLIISKFKNEWFGDKI